MKNTQIVNALKSEAIKNKVFADVCLMLYARERTAAKLNISTIKKAMQASGFKHSRADYVNVLRFLNRLGLGQLELSKRGKVRALVGLTVTLQSIGKAALSDSVDLADKRKMRKYDDIIQVTEQMHAKDFIEPTQAQSKLPNKTPVLEHKPKSTPLRAESPFPTFLTILVGTKPVNIPGPVNLTPDNMAEFVVNFKNLTKKNEVDV